MKELQRFEIVMWCIDSSSSQNVSYTEKWLQWFDEVGEKSRQSRCVSSSYGQKMNLENLKGLLQWFGSTYLGRNSWAFAPKYWRNGYFAERRNCECWLCKQSFSPITKDSCTLRCVPCSCTFSWPLALLYALCAHEPGIYLSKKGFLLSSEQVLDADIYMLSCNSGFKQIFNSA